MSFKVHVIHDLMYGFNESTEFSDLNLPDVDLVIFNGNIGLNSKRTMLYATELTKKYPNVQFVLNFGWYEMYLGHVPKTPYEFEDNISVRIQNSDDWPKNLHWCKTMPRVLTCAPVRSASTPAPCRAATSKR